MALENEMKNEKVSKRNGVFKSTKNILFLILLTAVTSGNPKIFLAFCMSFPFLLPLMTAAVGSESKKLIVSGLIYTIPGIIVSFIISSAFAIKNPASLWYIPIISLTGLIIFSLSLNHINHKKVVYLKTAIFLLIFMLISSHFTTLNICAFFAALLYYIFNFL